MILAGIYWVDWLYIGFPERYMIFQQIGCFIGSGICFIVAIIMYKER
jgi:hypothetical protein